MQSDQFLQIKAGKHRNIRGRKDLQAWLGRVGLPCHPPHKFRHGYAVYALKNAKDVPAHKEVIQNLIHKNLSVIDGVYGILSDLDVREQIALLGKNVVGKFDKNDLIFSLKRLVEQLESFVRD